MESFTTIRLEAESATVGANPGASTGTTGPVITDSENGSVGNQTQLDNASGNAFVDFSGLPSGGNSFNLGGGEFVEWTVNVAEAGEYDIAIGYAFSSGGADNRHMRLDVNGGLHDRIFDMRDTGDNAIYDEATTRITLNAGDNTVRLTSNGFSGPNIDYLEVRAPSASLFVFQAEDLATGGNNGVGPTTLIDGTGASDTYRIGAEKGGYLDWAGAGETAQFTLDAPGPGTYEVRITYAHGSGGGDRPLDLELVEEGGATNLATFAFARTNGANQVPRGIPDDIDDLDPIIQDGGTVANRGVNDTNLAAGWEGWSAETQTITLTEGGQVTLQLASNSRTTGPNIDKIEVIAVALDASAPTDITIDATSVDENADGAVIGALTVVDATPEAYTFAVDDARFEVVDGDLKLKAGESLNAEVDTGLEVTVTATDNAGSTDKTFAITVGDMNEAPVLADGASLDDVSLGLDETLDIDVVAALSATDEDAGQEPTYAVQLQGGGDLPDGISFDGTTISLDANGAAGTYTLEVTATDGTLSTAPVVFDVTVPGAFSPITVQGESDTVVLEASTPPSLVRTQTQNQEREPSDTPPAGFDEFGLRPGYTGDGYLDINGAVGDKADFTFDAPAGDYDVTVRLANGSNTDRAIDLRVNGSRLFQNQDTNTSEWFNWQELVFEVSFAANGEQTITIAQLDGAAPNIDAIQLTPRGVAANFAAPEVTSDAAFSVMENIAEVGTVTADDLDGDALTFSIINGADSALFDIDDTTGALSFIEAPDFETDLSASQTNQYEVDVEVSDGVEAVTQTITVTVTDDTAEDLGEPVIEQQLIQAETGVITLAASDSSFTQPLTQDNEAAEIPGGDKLLDEFNLRAGYTGIGYMDYGNDPGDSVAYSFTVAEDGFYDLSVRYSSQDQNVGPRTLDLSVNGASTTQTFPGTGTDAEGAQGAGFNNWGVVTFRVQLNAGENTIALAIPAGRNAGPNVDVLALTTVGTTANFAAPVFAEPLTFALNEGETLVGSIAASDQDNDTTDDTPAGGVTYAILDGGDSDKVAIDEITGEVSLNSAADFEAQDSFAVIVTATDDQNAVTQQAVTITVNDINEAPVLTENAAIADLTTEVGVEAQIDVATALSATDPEGQPVSYDVRAQGDDPALPTGFSIADGTLVIAADVDPGTYSLEAFASDGGLESTPVSFSVTVPEVFETVTVQGESTDGNVAILDTDSTTAVLSEGGQTETNGNASLNEFDLWPGYTGTGYIDINGGAGDKVSFTFDAPAGTYDVTVRYANGSSAARPISVRANEGDAQQVANTVTGDWFAWDEAVFTVMVDDRGTHTLILAQDSPPGAPNIDAIQVTLPGVPANFAAPEITSDAAFSVAENVAEVGAVTAEDLDGDALTFSIINGADAALFDIDGTTGVLSFKTAPNFENDQSASGTNDYQVEVDVSDGQESVSQLITVSVTDENEAPVLTENAAIADVTTDLGVEAQIDVAAALGATDPEGEAVTYDVRVQGEDPALPAGFSVAGGALVIAADAAPGTYTLEAFATDGAVESAPVPFSVTVPQGFTELLIQGEDLTLIADGDDNPFNDSRDRTQSVNPERLPDNNPGLPEFDEFGIRPDYTGDGYLDVEGDAGNKASFTVEAPAGLYDVTIRVANGADGDRALDLVVNGTPLGAPQETMTGEFYLWETRIFQVEFTDPGIQDIIIAQTGVGAPNIDAVMVTERGVPANFAAPEITSDASFDVVENETVVGVVTADDLDGDSLTFAIDGGDDADQFDIDETTGELSFISAPDFEAPGSSTNDNTYQVTVAVSDGGTPVTQDITVSVTDDPIEGTGEPVIEQILLQGEDGAITLAASDASFTQPLTQDNDAAETPGNGKILDEFNLRAGYTGTGYMDYGNDAGDSVAYSFTVAEAGFYDLHVRYASQDAGNAPRSLDLSINEGDSTETTFLSTTTDASGAQGAGFNNWGFITVRVQLEAGENTVALAIPAGKTAGPNVDALALTTANVSPDFAAPVFADPVDFTINEGETAVGSIAASDVDNDTTDDNPAPAPTYEISGGDDADLFDIDAATGAISFIAAPDFETPGSAATSNVYSLEVSASDGVFTTAQAVTVTVADVNENAPFTPIVIQEDDPAAAITLAQAPDAQSTQVRNADNVEPNSGTIRPGFSGDGYLDYGNDAGDTITFTFDVPTAGTYDFNVRYASNSLRPLDLTVNDVQDPSAMQFASTDPDGQGGVEGFDTWVFLTRTITLQEGTNTVSLAIPTGANTGPNIDRVEITTGGTGPIPAADETADEGGDLTIVPVFGTVGPDDLDAVTFDLSGVDADIVLFEVSTDGGSNFAAITPTILEEGSSVTLDLSAFAGSSAAPVTLRVTDGAGNTAQAQTSIVIDGDAVTPFSETFQAELFSVDDTVGTEGGALTQPRTPEAPQAGDLDAAGDANGDGLWDGWTGNGYLDMGANVGDAAFFTVTAPEAGTYTMTVRYANAGGAQSTRPMAVSIDGQSAGELQFAPTGIDGAGWANWTDEEITITLDAGENVIRLENTIANGPNIDSVTIENDASPFVEPGPRETIQINFQDSATPVVAGFLVDNFDGFGDRGNGQSYGWVTEASAIDADGTTATPIDGDAFPAIAINVRSGGAFDTYNPLLTGYAHFDLPSYPGRTAWEIALDDGFYEVTVSVGDTGGPNDSDNVLFVEGNLTTSWTATDEYKSQLITTVVEVQDGFLTLSAQGGTITEMQYLEIRALPDLTPDDANPATADYASFFDVRAIAGVGENEEVFDLDLGDGVRPDGVDPTSDIFLGINVVDTRGGALLESLEDGSVKLFETLTGDEVAINVNTTGGFDSLTVSPLSTLKEFTSYTLKIDGFQDRGSNEDLDAPTREFQKFSTTFVTGEAPEIVEREVAFNETIEINGAADGAFAYTSLELSPTGEHLYAVSLGGEIKRWDIDPVTGALDVGSEEVFAPGGDFDVPGEGRRGFIGITFDPQDPDTIWVTDNYPIPLSGRDNGVPDFSGRVSKVELGDGGSLADATISSYITGLPRSNGDHVTNSLEFRANPDAGLEGEPEFLLYLIQGSNSAMGAPDSAWGFRPERLLNATVMEIDHTRTAPEGGFDVTTEPLPDDGQNRRFEDTDNDLKNGGIAIDSGEFEGNFLHFDEQGVASVRAGEDASSALIEEFYNPFAEDAVLKIFATGPRNAYDLVWHSNGFLYVPTNGSAAGGNVPDDPDTVANEAFNGVEKQDDYLFRVVEGGYYGHPNPLHDQFILNGGNPTAGQDPNQVNAYPVGTQPDPDYDLEGAYSVGENRSPNGAIEYTSDVFGASLQGAVLFTEYSGGNDVRAVLVDDNGVPVQDFVLQDVDGNTITYSDPLDIIQGADGRLYLLTLNRGNGQSQIVRLDPAPGGVIGDNTADEGSDLSLTLVDGSVPGAIEFDIDGQDSDIVSFSISIDGGASTIITPDANGGFNLDMSAFTGPTPVVLTVEDDDGNTATAATTVTPGDTTNETNIDAIEFTVLSDLTGDAETIIRRIDDESTYEQGAGNDANGDGLNDNYDGLGYLDPNGGPEDKASFDFTAPVGGTYTVTLRMANGSGGAASPNPRPIAIKVGDQVIEIDNTNTGGFTEWVDFPITLRFEQGLNTVTIEQTGVGAPNIDSVSIVPDQLDSGTPNDGEIDIDGVIFVQYEAENAALDGAVVIPETEEDRNASGTGFVDFNGTEDQSITWTIEVDETGTYDVDILYALSTTKEARPMQLLVDGVPADILPFAPNSNTDENQWGPQSTLLALTAGVHEITVIAPGANGPNVDQLRITKQVAFDPVYAAIDDEGRIEVEALDGTARLLDDDLIEVFFTVADDGVYVFDAAANAGAPDGGDLTFTLKAEGEAPIEIDMTDFPGEGDAGEVNAYAELEAGVNYSLSVSSSAPGANALDYIDVRVAPGNPNADLEVESLDPTFFDNRLHYSFLANPTENDGSGNDRDFKDSGTVRLTNSGTEDLEVIEADLDGPFDLVQPDILDGLVLAAGESIDVEIVFDETEYDAPTGSNAQIDNTSTVFEGSLRLVTNDADSPLKTVDLAGFWQLQPEGGDEPNVNEIWEVFGFGNRIEGLSLAGGGQNSVLSTNDVFASTDETEVLSPYWKLAEGVTEAKITQIAAYHGPGGASVGIHNPGNKGQGPNFWNHGGDDNQMILPNAGGGNDFATETFGAGDIPDSWQGDDVFGIKVANLSTDPRLNPNGGILVDVNGVEYTQIGNSGNANGPDGVVAINTLDLVQQGHTVKMYQAVDADGNIIPNVFLGVMDYTGINYDYNDNLFIIEGVAPVGFGSEFGLSGLDDAAADQRLVLSRIDNPANGSQEFRDEATFEISNDGFEDLTINGLTIGGASPEAFEVTDGPADGTVLTPGQSVSVTVAFIGEDTVDDNQAVLFEAALEVDTDALPVGTQTIALSGLAQIQSEGGEEPTVAQIVEALGYSTDVAQNELNGNGAVETVGDEVLLPYLQRLDPSQDVEIIQVAAYLQQGDVARLSIHGLGSSDTAELFAQDDQQGQTLLPDGLVEGAGNTGGVARASVDSDDPFGLYVSVDGRPTFASWTDPEINRIDPEFGQLVGDDQGHLIRFFEAKDANGDVIEGTYIGIQDYPGAGNYDYNDHMFVIKNVQAYALTDEDDANDNGINDALENDADIDGTVDFFDDDFTQPTNQAPFPGPDAPTFVDGSLTIDATNYDQGGQGVAYNDAPGLQGGPDLRDGEDVEFVGAENDIGFIEDGEWLEYTIDVPQSGTYLLSLNAKTPIAGNNIGVSVEGDTPGDSSDLATILIPDSNGASIGFGGTEFDDTVQVPVTLAAGVQTLRFTFNGAPADNGYVMDFRSFSLEAGEANQQPIAGEINAPEATQGAAFDFDASTVFSDPDGDDLEFDATGLPDGLDISDDGVISGTPSVSGTFTVTVTASDGDLDAFDVFDLTVNEAAIDGQTPFPGPDAPSFVDGVLTIDASNYDDGGQGVAYNDTAGLSGGSNGGRAGSDVEQTPLGDIGWIADDEWLEYTINVGEAGTYDLELLMSNNGGGGRTATLEFYLPGSDTPYASSDPIDNPVTGGWTTFLPRTQEGISLQAGEQIVRVTFNGGSQDIRSFSLTAQGVANQQPIAGEIDAPEATEGAAFSFDASTVFSDPDGDELDFEASGLPDGLDISEDGVITGTPTVSGTFTVTVTASDGALEAFDTFDLTVNDAPNQQPVAGEIDAPDATEGAAFNFDASTVFSDPDGDALDFEASGLPAGLDISEDGVIFGTPEVSGTFTVTVTASDGDLEAFDVFDLTVNDAPSDGQSPFPGPGAPGFVNGELTIDASNYDDGGQGVAYNDGAGLSGSGTNGGRAGSGVEQNQSGDIGWTRGGEWLEYTITVGAAGAYDLGILLSTTRDGRSVTVDFYRPGEDTPYTSTGSIDNPSTGSWSNFQTRTADALTLEAGEQIVRVTFDNGRQDLRAFTLTAQDQSNQQPIAGEIDAPDAVEGDAFSFDASTVFSDPDGDDLSFDADGLPDGLDISDDGVIFGTPTISGTFTVTVTASDGELEAFDVFDLTVNEAVIDGQAPFPGPNAPTFVDGALTVDATNYDQGGQGVAYNDAPGLQGGPDLRGGDDVEFVGPENDIGFIEDGEWLEYTIEVPQDGTYLLSLNAKTPIAGNNVAVSLEDGEPLATIAITDSNGASTGFDGTTFGETAGVPVTLAAGVQTLRFTFNGAPADNGYIMDFRSFSVTEQVTPNQQPVAGEIDAPEAIEGAAFNFDASTVFSDPDGDELGFEASGLPAGLDITDDGVIFGTPEVSGNFTVTVTASDGELEAFDTFDLTVNEPNALQTVMQVGQVTTDQESAAAWTSVTFDEAMIDPVVVMSPPTQNDSDFAVMRVRNVTSTGFEFQIDEWDYLDGIHGQETIGWMAVERGTHEINGQTVVAGSQSIGTSFSRVDFDEGAFDTAPVVFSQVSSDNGPEAVATRATDISDGGVDLKLEEEEGTDNVHAAEEVSYVAIETGGSNTAGFFANNDASSTSNGTVIDYSDDFNTAAQTAFFADMQTYNGPDTAAVRISSRDGNSASVFVEEEQASNAEINHTDETIGYFVIETGTYSVPAVAQAPAVATLFSAESLPNFSAQLEDLDEDMPAATKQNAMVEKQSVPSNTDFGNEDVQDWFSQTEDEWDTLL